MSNSHMTSTSFKPYKVKSIGNTHVKQPHTSTSFKPYKVRIANTHVKQPHDLNLI
jgi:hypothetical protein